jgi:hypothetical protein
MIYPTNLSFVAALLLFMCYANAGKNTCKSVKFVGKILKDIPKTRATHSGNLLIFWGKDYTIGVEGYLLGWTVYQNVAASRGLYMDVWRLEGTDFVLLDKTKLLTNEKRNYTVGLKGKIKVCIANF